MSWVPKLSSSHFQTTENYLAKTGLDEVEDQHQRADLEQAIEADAKAIAKRHGIEADERLISILKSTAVIDLQVHVKGKARPLSYYPSIQQALHSLPPEKAYAIFESADRAQLFVQQELVEYLTWAGRFWLTLTELNEILRDYKLFLVRNRDHIAGTGFPETTFASSEFIDVNLSNTYPTRVPASFYGSTTPSEHSISIGRGSTPKDEYGNTVFSMIWTTEDPVSVYREKSARFEKTVSNLSPCKYQESAPIAGLGSDEIEFIEASRPKLVEAKIEIVDEVLNALGDERRVSSVVDSCVRILADRLSYDDMERWKKIERVYSGSKVESYLANRRLKAESRRPYSLGINKLLFGDHRQDEYLPQSWNLTGSISGLFWMIGFLQKELAIGTFVKTKESLQDISEKAQTIRSYYQALADGWNEELNGVLDAFLAKDDEETRAWDHFTADLESTLERDFRKKVTIDFELLGRYEEKYRPILFSLLEAQANHLNETGELLGIEAVAQALRSEKSRPTNFFRKAGEGFEIAFGGRDSIFMKDTKGLKYIYFLIQNPNQNLHVGELIRAVDGPFDADPDYNKMSREQLESEGLSDSYGFGYNEERLSTSTRRELTARIEELKEQKSQASLIDDEQRVREIEDELESIITYLRDRGRPQTDQVVESQRASVRIAIVKAMRNIEKHDEELASHLWQRIETGIHCRYRHFSSSDPTWHMS